MMHGMDLCKGRACGNLPRHQPHDQLLHERPSATIDHCRRCRASLILEDVRILYSLGWLQLDKLHVEISYKF